MQFSLLPTFVIVNLDVHLRQFSNFGGLLSQPLSWCTQMNINQVALKKVTAAGTSKYFPVKPPGTYALTIRWASHDIAPLISDDPKLASMLVVTHCGAARKIAELGFTGPP